MGKCLFGRVTACVVVSAFFIVTPSCVNDKYELSEENLDLNVTLFQEGVSLPLGSTVPVSLKDILDKMDLGEDFEKYFKTADDGSYMVSVKDTYDVSEELEALSDILDIDAFRFTHTADLSLKDVDVSEVRIKPLEFSMEKKLSELITLPNVNIPEMGAQSVSIPAGLSDYSGVKEQINNELTLPDYMEDYPLVSYVDRNSANHEQALNTAKMYLESLPENEKDMEYTIEEEGVSVGGILNIKPVTQAKLDQPVGAIIDVPLPEGIKDISAITFENAYIDITIKLKEHFLKSGHIDPTIDLDLHDVFHLPQDENENHPNQWDHVVEMFDLTDENGWEDTHSIKIESLVINKGSQDGEKKGDIVEENGKRYFRKDIDVYPNVVIEYRDVVTTPRLMLEYPEVIVEFDVRFRNVGVDDIVFSTDPVEMEFTKTVSVGSENGIDVPKEIEKISSISFTDDSKLSLAISAQNAIPGLGLTLDHLQFEFPESLTIRKGDGYNVSGNTLTVENVAILGEPYELDVMLDDIVLSEPENGKIYIDEEVKVKAKVSATGENVSLSDIPTASDKDMSVNVTVKPELKFDDASLVIASTGFPISQNLQEINESLPDAVKDLKVVTVYLEDDPKISVEMDIPDLSSILGEQIPIRVTPAADGISLYFPDMLKFAVADEYAAYYSHADHALQYKTEFADVVFPIEKLAISPVLENGKAYARGDVKIEGGVSVTGGEITYKQIKRIVESPDAKFSFKATMDELAPKQMELGTFETSAGRFEENIDLLKDVQVPDMLEQLQMIELDDVKLSLNVDGSRLPSLGAGAKVAFEVSASLPDFVVLDENDERVKNNSLLFSVDGEDSKDGKGIDFKMEPVKIVGLDLSDVDFKSDKPLEQKIVLDATLKIKDLAVDIKSLEGDYAVALEAVIKSDKDYPEGEKEKIGIKSVKGRVNYAIDPVEEVIDLSELFKVLNEDGLEANIDLDRFYIALDVTTNLGVAAEADLKITPRYNGEYDLERVLEPDKPIELSAAENAQDMKKTSLWISNTDEGMPAGYEFVKLDLIGLLRDIPEAIKLNLTAGTDKDQVCVFEPGAEYKLVAEYNAGLPLAFGDDFLVEYTYLFDDVPDVLAQIMEYGTLGLGGSVTSSIPLNFEVSATLLDSDGDEIEMADVSGKQTIKGCGPDGAPVQTPLNLILQKKKGIDVSDISSIRLKFRADSRNVSGIPFREDSFLQIKLNARIPEGVTVDLGEYAFPEEQDDQE